MRLIVKNAAIAATLLVWLSLPALAASPGLWLTQTGGVPSSGGGGPAAPTFVNAYKTFYTGSNCSSPCSQTIAATSAGDEVVIWVILYLGTSVQLSFADSALDTCSFVHRSDNLANGSSFNGINPGVTMGICPSVSAGVTSVSATQTAGGGALGADITVMVFHRTGSSSPSYEQDNGNVATSGATVTSPLAGATTVANEMLVVSGGSAGGTGGVSGCTNGFTNTSATQSCYNSVTSTGSYSTDVTFTGSPTSASTVIVALKP